MKTDQNKLQLDADVQEARVREKLITVEKAKELIGVFYGIFDEVVKLKGFEIHRDNKGDLFVYPSELAKYLETWGEIHLDCMEEDEEEGEAQ